MDDSSFYEKSEELYNNIHASFSNLLSNLDSEFNLNNYKIFKFVSIFTTKFEKTEQKKILDSTNFIDLEFSRIEKFTSYPQLFDEISKNPSVIDYAKSKKSPLELEVKSIIICILITYFDKNDSFEYKNDVFKKIIFSLFKYLVEDYKFLHCFIPIYGLTGNFPRLDIDKDKVIRRIESYEFDVITNLAYLNYKYVDRKFHNLEYVLDIKLEPSIPTNQIAIPILESLRLLKRGQLHMGAAYPFVSGLKGLPIRPKLGDESPPEPSHLFEFNDSEFQNFLDIYKNLIKLRGEFDDDDIRYINFALRRFGKSYYEKNIEDKITDLTIALETLLNKESYEVTLRLSLVTSMLLGKDEDEREFIFKFINKCYSVRSEIVHGKQRKSITIMGQNYSDEQLGNLLENMTRESLKKIIKLHEKYKSQEKLLVELTNIIVNRNTTKKFFEPETDG